MAEWVCHLELTKRSFWSVCCKQHCHLYSTRMWACIWQVSSFITTGNDQILIQTDKLVSPEPNVLPTHVSKCTWYIIYSWPILILSSCFLNYSVLHSSSSHIYVLSWVFLKLIAVQVLMDYLCLKLEQTMCMIGVVERYKELAKFNLRQLTSSESEK
jgi:hypothetical protein